MKWLQSNQVGLVGIAICLTMNSIIVSTPLKLTKFELTPKGISMDPSVSQSSANSEISCLTLFDDVVSYGFEVSIAFSTAFVSWAE